MSKRKAIIVIPVYKENIDDAEEKSLKQCFEVLRNYPVTIIHPENLNCSAYVELCRKYSATEYSFMSFENYYFQSILSYCRLLLSAKFYNKFNGFEYMLLYQPDAFVFSDELEKWMSKEFDYIGAPWFLGHDTSGEDAPFLEFAGNGGFSLRNVGEALKVIRTYKVTKGPGEIWEEFTKHQNPLRIISRLPIILLRMLGLRNNSIYERTRFTENEDLYWAFEASKVRPGFRVAKAAQAIDFAFELHPKRLFALNGNRLPFGCHAWLKWDAEFWKQYIK